jgi:hypothetical protein
MKRPADVVAVPEILEKRIKTFQGDLINDFIVLGSVSIAYHNIGFKHPSACLQQFLKIEATSCTLQQETISTHQDI